MTDYERRLTQKTERYMTQSEHKRLCGLRRCRVFCGNFIRHRNTPREKKRKKKDKARRLWTKDTVVPKLIPFAPTVQE